MSYSLATMPNDPALFVPPKYALWVERARYTYKNGKYEAIRSVPVLGQVRHFDDLKKAKRRAGAMSTGWGDRLEFLVDWALYEWTGTEYKLIYDGMAGEKKANNLLFKTRLTKKALGEAATAKKGIDYEIDAAVASILEAAS